MVDDQESLQVLGHIPKCTIEPCQSAMNLPHAIPEIECVRVATLRKLSVMRETPSEP